MIFACTALILIIVILIKYIYYQSSLIKRAIFYHQKNLRYFMFMVRWFTSKQYGNDIGSILVEKGYKTAAIYGMNYVGECLLRELMDSKVEVKYVIDRVVTKAEGGIKVCSPMDDLADVDVVLVTAIMSYDEVNASLKERLDSVILSIEDVIRD